MKTFIFFLGLLSAVLGVVFTSDGAFFAEKICFDGSNFDFCGSPFDQESNVAFVDADVIFDSASNEYLVGYIQHVSGGGVALHDSIFIQRFDLNGAAVGNKIPVLEFFADQEGKSRPRIAFDSVNNRALVAYEYIFFDEPNPEIPEIRFCIVNLDDGSILINNALLSKFNPLQTPSTHVSVLFNPTDQVYAFTYFGSQSSNQGKSQGAFQRVSAAGADLGAVIFSRGGLDTINPSLALTSTNSYIIAAEVIDANGNSDLFAVVSSNIGNFDFDSSVALSNVANANETEVNLEAFGTQIAAVFVSKAASVSMGVKLLNAVTLAEEDSTSVADFNSYEELYLTTNGNTEIAVIYRANGNLIQLTVFNAALNQLDSDRVDVPNNAANYFPNSPTVVINPNNKDHLALWSTAFIEANPSPLPPGFITSTGTTGASNIIAASFFLVVALVAAVVF